MCRQIVIKLKWSSFCMRNVYKKIFFFITSPHQNAWDSDCIRKERYKAQSCIYKYMGLCFAIKGFCLDLFCFNWNNIFLLSAVNRIFFYLFYNTTSFTVAKWNFMRRKSIVILCGCIVLNFYCFFFWFCPKFYLNFHR